MGYEGTDEETSLILMTNLGHAMELVLISIQLTLANQVPFHNFNFFILLNHQW